MTEFLQIGIGGATIGSVYALLALVWVVVFRVSHVLFLIAGEFVILSALTTVTLTELGLGLWVSALGGVLVCIGLALVVEIVLRLVPGITPLSIVLLMIGLTYLIAQVASLVFGSTPRLLPSFLPTQPVVLAGVSVTPHQLLLLGTTALIAILLTVFVRYTMLGKALAASSEEPDGARIVGIDPVLMRAVSLIIAAIIGGVAGVLLVPIYPMHPFAGLNFSLVGFTAAALGGWSFAASGIAGLILGLLSNYIAGYVSSAYQEVFTFGILIVVLIVATLKIAPKFLAERLRE